MRTQEWANVSPPNSGRIILSCTVWSAPSHTSGIEWSISDFTILLDILQWERETRGSKAMSNIKNRLVRPRLELALCFGFSVPFHHVFKDDHWHHGYSDDASAGIKDVHDLGVLIKEIKSNLNQVACLCCTGKIWTSFTFSPMMFWPLISQIWWSVRRPLRAAELSCTIEMIRPFL